MVAFKRNATVAYDARNISILGVESISSPEPVEVKADDLRQIFSTALSGNGTSDDAELSDAVVFQLGWILRSYQDNFRGVPSLPLDLLLGFLVVPLQFSTLALVAFNATFSQTDPPIFRALIPQDMETTASAAYITYRALATPWIVYIFIASAWLLLIWASVISGYILTQSTVVPNTSVFPEIDVSSKSSASITLPEYSHGIEECSAMLRNEHLGNAETHAIITAIQRKRIRVAQLSDGNESIVVLVTGKQFLKDVDVISDGVQMQKLVRRKRYG